MTYKIEFEESEIEELLDAVKSSLYEYEEEHKHYNDKESNKKIELCKNLISKINERKNMQQIKIKYHTDIKPITIEKNGDWIDLRCAEEVDMKAGEFKIISLGVSMEILEGYEAHVVPRSSTFKKWGIIQTNHMGVIDNSYNGEQDIWSMPCLALRDTHIYKNDRICQFRLVKNQEPIELIEVEHLNNKNRGGFGSTGTN